MDRILKKIFKNYHTKMEYCRMALEFHFYISLVADIICGLYKKERNGGKTPEELDKAEKDVIRLHFVLSWNNKRYKKKDGFTVDSMREGLAEEILSDLVKEAKVLKMLTDNGYSLRYKRRKELRELYSEYRQITDFSVFSD